MAIVEILFIGAVGASFGLFLGVVLTLAAFRNQKSVIRAVTRKRRETGYE